MDSEVLYAEVRNMDNRSIECLNQGQLDEAHFDLLIESTSIRSKAVINALRDHLVHGVDKVIAVERNRIFFSQFSSRLSILEYTSDRVSRMAKYYCSNEACPLRQ